MENTIKKRGRPPKNPVELPQNHATSTPAIRDEDTSSVTATAPAKSDSATIRSIRMTDETHNALNELKVSLGDSSLEATLRQMISAFHLSDARKAFPERDTEIAQFEALSRKLIDSYVHSLILCNDAEERAKAEVKTMLESKDQIIVDLQQKAQEQEDVASFRDGVAIGQNAFSAAEFIDIEQIKAYSSGEKYGRKKRMKDFMTRIYAEAERRYDVELKLF